MHRRERLGNWGPGSLGAWELGSLGACELGKGWGAAGRLGARGPGSRGAGELVGYVAEELGSMGVGKMGARELGALCERQNYVWVPPAPPDLGSMPFFSFCHITHLISRWDSSSTPVRRRCI